MNTSSGFPSMQQIFERIFQDAPEYLVVLDPELNITVAGSAFRNACGLEQGTSASFLETVERFSLTKVRRAFEELREPDAGHRQFDIRHRRSDGEDFAVAYSWVACLDNTGACRAFVGIGRELSGEPRTVGDVSQLKEQLKKSKGDIRRRAEEIGQLRKQLQEQTTTDDLTGLGNRRFILERLEGEVARAVRYDSPLTLLLIDVDNMTHINETHTRDSGDAVLATIAETIKAQVRTTDLGARFEGSQFLVLCPHTDRASAQFLAERLRRRVAELEFESRNEDEDMFAVTVSLGLVTITAKDEADVENVLQAAEEALETAKRGGPNRVSLLEIV